jgi:nitrogen fixation protein FixH
MKKLLIAASFALCSGLVLADGDLKPQQGGVMAEAKSGHRVELVVSADMAMVYLSDHAGKPVAAKGSSGELTLLTGTEKTTVSLTAADGNILMASDKLKVTSGSKAIVKFTLPGKAEEQVRLLLK